MNDDDCTLSIDIAEAFNEYFASCAAKITEDMSANKCFEVPDNDDDLEYSFELKPVSSAFVGNEIKNMNAKKATGDDDISCRLLKIARPAIAVSLTKLINM